MRHRGELDFTSTFVIVALLVLAAVCFTTGLETRDHGERSEISGSFHQSAR